MIWTDDSTDIVYTLMSKSNKGSDYGKCTTELVYINDEIQK